MSLSIRSWRAHSVGSLCPTLTTTFGTHFYRDQVSSVAHVHPSTWYSFLHAVHNSMIPKLGRHLSRILQSWKLGVSMTSVDLDGRDSSVLALLSSRMNINCLPKRRALAQSLRPIVSGGHHCRIWWKMRPWLPQSVCSCWHGNFCKWHSSSGFGIWDFRCSRAGRQA